MSDEDFALALHLQEELDRQSTSISMDCRSISYDEMSVTDSVWELIDPNPDPRVLFLEFNIKYFWGMLDMVEVKWSSRMTLCAGVCVYEGKSGLCSIRLSEPLLKLRPRRDLVETLLHEMIHAYLFITNNNKDHEGHGPEFLNHMHRLNKATGAHITVHHNFNDEVENYRTHWWRCDGPCKNRKPFFGFVKRAMNRPPSSRDPWWIEHLNTCGGIFQKIREPEDFTAKKSQKQQQASKKIGKKVTQKSGLLDWMTSSDSCNVNHLRSVSGKPLHCFSNKKHSKSDVNSSDLSTVPKGYIDKSPLLVDKSFPKIKDMAHSFINTGKQENAITSVTDISDEYNFRDNDFITENISHEENITDVCLNSSFTLCKKSKNVLPSQALGFCENIGDPYSSLQCRQASDQSILQFQEGSFDEFKTYVPQNDPAVDITNNFHLKLPEVFEELKCPDILNQIFNCKDYKHILHSCSSSSMNMETIQPLTREHSDRMNYKHLVKHLDIQNCLSNDDIEVGTIIRLSNFMSVCNPNYHRQHKNTDNLFELAKCKRKFQLDCHQNCNQNFESVSSFILKEKSNEYKNLNVDKTKNLESGEAHDTTWRKDNNNNFSQSGNLKSDSANSFSALPYEGLSFDENKTIACIINQVRNCKHIVHQDCPSMFERNPEEIFSNIYVDETVS